MPRVVGDWTRDKLKILEAYLPGYLQATTSARDRVYIDAFAGPGKNQLRRSREIIDGSPLIALNARAQNDTRFSRLFFIDQDEEAIEELTGHVRDLDIDNRCKVVHGDINEKLPEIVQQLSPYAPTFVFLDTDAIEPKWTTIEKISPWRVELLINFPLGMSINRNPDSQKTLDYFGTADCLQLLSRSGTGRTRGLLDLYKGRLKELGFVHTTEDDRLIKTLSGKRLYYLVFVSKRTAGQTIMNWVFRQPDAIGQAHLGI
ncbi:MAG TPA: three-Cys-motif partner protein TcmP [Dehalococcoidia bacterium]